MIKQFIVSSTLLFSVTVYICHPPKTPPKEFPTTITKHESARIIANVQQLNKPAFATYLTTTDLKGARV